MVKKSFFFLILTIIGFSLKAVAPVKVVPPEATAEAFEEDPPYVLTVINQTGENFALVAAGTLCTLTPEGTIAKQQHLKIEWLTPDAPNNEKQVSIPAAITGQTAVIAWNFDNSKFWDGVSNPWVIS